MIFYILDSVSCELRPHRFVNYVLKNTSGIFTPAEQIIFSAGNAHNLPLKMFDRNFKPKPDASQSLESVQAQLETYNALRTNVPNYALQTYGGNIICDYLARSNTPGSDLTTLLQKYPEYFEYLVSDPTYFSKDFYASAGKSIETQLGYRTRDIKLLGWIGHNVGFLHSIFHPRMELLHVGIVGAIRNLWKIRCVSNFYSIRK